MRRFLRAWNPDSVDYTALVLAVLSGLAVLAILVAVHA